MKGDNEEGCKGCLSYYNCYSSSGLVRDSEFVERCPCKICLVKGMCVSVCDDFTDLINYYRSLR